MHFAPGNFNLELMSQDEVAIHTRHAARKIEKLYKLNKYYFDRIDFRLIQATEKSIVYWFLINKKKYIAKFHHHSCNFQQEYMAYLTLRSKYIPCIDKFDSKEHLLIYPFVQGNIFDTYNDSIEQVVKTLSNIHSTAQENLKIVSKLRNRKSHIGYLNERKKCQYLVNVFRDYVEIFGDQHIPLSVGDLKPEHVIVSTDGYVFIDLETFRIGRPQLYDILCLMNFMDDPRSFFELWENKLVYIYTSAFDKEISLIKLNNALRDYYEFFTIDRA